MLRASEALLVEADAGLGQSEAVLDRDGYELARVTEALGSPSRPMSAAELEAQGRLAGGRRAWSARSTIRSGPRRSCSSSPAYGSQGARQPPWPTTSSWAASGPQVPGS